MGRSNRSTSTPRTMKETGTQLSNNIPEMFHIRPAGQHVETQASSPDYPGSTKGLIMEDPAVPNPSLLYLQRDLQNIALYIKHTLMAAISDLKTDIQNTNHPLTEMEETSQLQAVAIRQVQKTHDLQLPHMFNLHSQVEDLDNRGHRHNIRLRGVPEGVEATELQQTVCSIFNNLLDRPADSPIEMEHINHALRPPPHDSEPPRDIICCIVNFPLKEEILRKARERGHILFNGADIKLFHHLSQITLQNRCSLRPLLDILCNRNIQYRWNFPFCRSATSRSRSALLRTPEDLPTFCEHLDIPLIDLPEWYSFYFPSEPWKPVSHGSSPKAQRPRSRCRRLDPTSPGDRLSRRDLLSHSAEFAATPRRGYQDA